MGPHRPAQEDFHLLDPLAGSMDPIRQWVEVDLVGEEGDLEEVEGDLEEEGGLEIEGGLEATEGG